MDDDAGLRCSDRAELDLLPEMSEAILLDFEPVRLNTVVDRRGLDLTAQRLDLLGDCELAEELEFALGFPEFMLDPGIGLSLREQLASGKISFDDHVLGPGEPVRLPSRIRSAQGDPSFKLLGQLGYQSLLIFAQRDAGSLELQLGLEAQRPRLADRDLLLTGQFLKLRRIQPAELVSFLDDRAILDHAQDHRAVRVGDILDLTTHRRLLNRLEIPARQQGRLQVIAPDSDPLDRVDRQRRFPLPQIPGHEPSRHNHGQGKRQPKPDRSP